MNPFLPAGEKAQPGLAGGFGFIVGDLAARELVAAARMVK